MRRFNPEKELSKIRNGNKNKIILGLCTLLLIVVVGYSFALYQVRHTQKLVFNTISDFKKRDIYLSVLVDGKTQGDFPKNNEGKIYSGIDCDKPYSEAYFDNTEWKLHFTSDGPNKCTIKFETGNLPNAPELFQGMIPIVYGDNGIMYVADTNKDWYNYQDHRWGNAVLVDASNETIKTKYFDENNQLREDIAGKEVPMEEVLQMYVWIPRYKYQIFNVGSNGVDKQLINIKFEEGTDSTGDIKCTYINNNDGTITEKCVNNETQEQIQVGEWYTHPAFKFGETELKGIWVGKFEPSDPTDLNGKINSINEITILPGKTSMVNKSVSTMFNATRNIEKERNKYNLLSAEMDSHMMKNFEWGAVAYLTQSVYGIYKDEKTCNISNTSFEQCEVWINNTAQGVGDIDSGSMYTYSGSHTGCVGDSISANVKWNTEENTPAKCDADKRWNTGGVKASTTGNMYGIYDMAGGTFEFMMSGMIDEKGSSSLFLNQSNFDSNLYPDEKYYADYAFDESYTTYERGYFGDATKETLRWNSDGAEMPCNSTRRYVFMRSGCYIYKASVGIFEFAEAWGSGGYYYSFRVVLTAQDGSE